MPKHTTADYLADAYDDPADAEDGYDQKKHPKRKSKPVEDIIEHVAVEPRYHKTIIGPQGSVKAGIEDRHNVIVDVPRKDSNECKIYVNGRPSDVRAAMHDIKVLVEERIARDGSAAGQGVPTTAFPSLPGQELVAISVDLEKAAHGLFIGSQGTRIRDLRARLSSKDFLPLAAKEVGVDVTLPDRSDTSDIITVRVPNNNVDRAMRVIREFCEFYELLPHLRSISAAGVVGAVLKGDAAAGNRGVKAPRTKNPQQQQSSSSSSNAAAAASAAAAAPAATAATIDLSNTKKDSHLTTAATSDHSFTRPARVFASAVDGAFDRHEVLPCRF